MIISIWTWYSRIPETFARWSPAPAQISDQPPRCNRYQKLNVQQLFALADRGWSNIALLWSSRTDGGGSRFLWLAALLIGLGAVLQPLTSGMVTFDAIAATSCFDIPVTGCSTFGPTVIDYDPEPADMHRLPRDLVLQDVVGRLVAVLDTEPQTNLWPFISRSDFPSPCPGPEPVNTHVERPGLTLNVCAPGNASQFPFTPSRHRQDIIEHLYVDLEVSQGGAYLSYTDNFTIHCTASTSRGYFELGNEGNDYIYDPLLDRWPDPDDIEKNFNDYRSSGAGFARPTAEDLSTWNGSDLLPSENVPVLPFRYEFVSVLGPLMVSAEALFGNYSLLRFVANNVTGLTPTQAYEGVCEHGNIPFSQSIYFIQLGSGVPSFCSDAADKVSQNADPQRGRYDYDLDDYLTRVVGTHVRLFNSTNYAEYALMMSMYFANTAVLTKTALLELPYWARKIYHSPGTIMARPRMATASLIVLSILVFLQTAGLLAVAWLIYSVPTCAPALDAMQVAQIGKALADDDLSPLGPVTPEDEKRLTKIDGLVGRVARDKADGGELADVVDANAGTPLADGGSAKKTDRVELALGGKGLITR
ncbi:hypothetical protein GGR54DRAFT_649144 [Hypoxylon sp. NC1633]|nr:hypothetical protein GGR54DRAFT_649144 [Hypoxylon sp. NC1633]